MSHHQQDINAARFHARLVKLTLLNFRKNNFFLSFFIYFVGKLQCIASRFQVTSVYYVYRFVLIRHGLSLTCRFPLFFPLSKRRINFFGVQFVVAVAVDICVVRGSNGGSWPLTLLAKNCSKSSQKKKIKKIVPPLEVRTPLYK